MINLIFWQIKGISENNLPVWVPNTPFMLQSPSVVNVYSVQQQLANFTK